MHTRLTFHGGAEEVTGANFLLETDTTKLLIDCGAHQRENLCDPRNHAPFPYDVKAIDALIVTHAHQDHIGLIPKLVQEGFRGTIHSTAATRDLAEVMLDDALSVMEREAIESGCAPIYDRPAVEAALAAWETHPYHVSFTLADLQATFLDAGHILGSAMVRVTPQSGGKSIIFTGDLGNTPEPLLRDTESPEGANYLVMESVYGDRLHEGRDTRREMLRAAIEAARAKGGTLLIPSFSLERTQILLYELHELISSGALAPIPVYLDSPLAERVLTIFRRYIDLCNTTAQEAFSHGDAFSFPGFVEVHSTGESAHLHRKADPKVIIAGAGMSHGGRIRTHEKTYLPDERASVLLTGYQAPGSLGRRIQDGASEVVIDGARVKVHASVRSLTGYSGHADRDQLLAFVEKAQSTLTRVFVTMGEPKAAQFLAQRIHDFLGCDAYVPATAESVDIEL